MTVQTFAALTALKDIAAAGYRPAPMIPGGDGAAGWTCGPEKTPAEFHEAMSAQALDHMPAEAEALPGIVAGDGVVILRAFGAMRGLLPETPARWTAGDSVVAVYRAPDVSLSSAYDFGFARSFGWRLADDRGDLFILERDVAVEVPAGVTLPAPGDLPALNDWEIGDALDAAGAFDGDQWPERTAEPHDPVAAWTCARNAKDRGGKVHGLFCRDVLIPSECPPDPFERERAEAEAARLAEREEAEARAMPRVEADAVALALAGKDNSHLFDLHFVREDETRCDRIRKAVSAALAEAAEKAVEARDVGQGQDAPASPEPAPTAPAADPYAGLYDVPGLVGEITRWIVATSHRPLPLHALGAALVAVGTAAGRKYKGPTFSGTHLYIAALAVTGAGKDHPGAALLAILEAAGMGEHTGASSFKSASSIISLIARSPLTAMKIDEFGAFLKKMNDVKGGSHLTEMSGELRSLWGSSFKVYKTPEWQGIASKTIHAPAVSIFGTTTPTDFYEGLRGADATNGFLNRFLVLEAAGRPAMQEPTADPSEVPAHIAEAMAAIYASGGNLGAVSRNDPGKPQAIVNVPWGEGAKVIYDEALRHAERIADQNPSRGDYYSRSAEMALRMATIVGIGCNPAEPVVTAEAMRWAIRVVAVATKALFTNADALIADNVAQANYKMVKAIIRKAKGEIGRSALTKAIDGRLPPRVTDDILAALVEAGDVEKIEGQRAPNGKVPVTYRITAQGA